MIANKNLLRMKFARVIEAYAKRMGCSLDEALDRFYRSNVYAEMRDGISDMHCMSDEYLVDELEGASIKQCICDIRYNSGNFSQWDARTVGYIALGDE